MNIEYDEGYKAFLDGKPRTANPYCFCSAQIYLWDEGWGQAEADAVKEKTESKTGNIG